MALYTDTINTDGTPRGVDGSFTQAGNIPSGYNPELPKSGEPLMSFQLGDIVPARHY